MHIRMLTANDVSEVVAIIDEVSAATAYGDVTTRVQTDRIADMLQECIFTPDMFPCFVYGDDHIRGLLYAAVYPNYYTGELWFECRVLYVRQEYRSMRVVRALMDTATEWCREQNVVWMEFGNAVSRDERIGMMFKRMGYAQVNTVYGRRL